jgi:hypothetical protein
MHECLDKRCLRGHDHQIASENQARSRTRRRPFDRGHHRLVAAKDGADESLPALLEHAGDITGTPLRHRLTPVRLGRQSRTGAEVFRTGSTE